MLSKLTYGLSIYGASKAYLVVMDYNSEKLSIYDLLKQSDRNLKLCDKISKDKHHPLYSILLNVRGDSHESRSNECDIGFQVQFNVEFTSQVMDFP